MNAALCLLVCALAISCPLVAAADQPSAFGHVALPYAGPGYVTWDEEAGTWIVAFPAPLGFSCTDVGYEFCGAPPAEAVWISGQVKIVVVSQEAFIIASDGIQNVMIAVPVNLVPAPLPPIPTDNEQSDPPSVERCPGGSCSCSGPLGSAEACCPAGFKASCICNKTESKSTCIKVNPVLAVLPPASIVVWNVE